MQKITTFSIVLLLFCFLRSHAQQSPDAMIAALHDKGFIENNGQIKDQYDRENQDVKYVYNDRLFNLQLKESGFSYEIFEVVKDEEDFDESGSDIDDDSDLRTQQKISLRAHRVDITFRGANRNVQPTPSYPVEAYFNYYAAPVTEKQHTYIKGFRKLTYPNLYDGIDLVFYAPGEEEELRYEFIVHPGANPSKISFYYAGASDLQVNESGDFRIHTSLGTITETKPVCYSEGKSFDGSFTLNRNELGFRTTSYDKSRFMIIDPNIHWGTYYGGEINEEISEVAVGADLGIVITGNTVSTTGIATAGAYKTTFSGGGYDYFVAKFKIFGTLQWGTYFGGVERDASYGVVTDQLNNVIAVGNSQSSGLGTPGVYKDTIDKKGDILIVKFAPNGTLKWCTYMGGKDQEHARSAICDMAGNIYLAGTTYSATGIASTGAYQTSYAGQGDTWIAKFTPAGQRIWSTYYSGGGQDRAHAVTLDLMGHLYVEGTCESMTGIATPGVYHDHYGGGETDVFLGKFDTSGHFIWGTYFGGAYDDRGRGVETDISGNVYIGGFTNSDTGVATPDGLQNYWAEGYYSSDGSRTEDAFLAKFSPEGQIVWGTYYGGGGGEQLWGMTIDRIANKLYIVGSTTSQVNIIYGNAYQSELNGALDGYIGKFNTDGSIEWGTYFGGEEGEQFEDVAVDIQGDIYIAGRLTSTSLLVTQGTHQSSSNGGSEVILYKFYPGSDCYDRFEPNESIANAKMLKAIYAIDTTIYGLTGSIVNGNDEDWFRISVKPSLNNHQFNLLDLPANYDLKIYNSQNVLIGESTNSGNSDETVTLNGLPKGKIFIQVVHDPSTYDSLDCYRLLILKSNSPFRTGVEDNSTFPGTLHVSDNLLIFPNPAQDQLTLRIISQQEGKSGILIFDVLDRIVYSDEITLSPGVQDVSIHCADLSAGPHHVLIQNKHQTWNGTFIKQ